MMEKKRMAALLAAVLFGMSAIPAGAVNLIDTDAAATDSAEHAELDLYGVRATVTDRQDGELTVSTETAGTVVVHIASRRSSWTRRPVCRQAHRISKRVMRCTSTAGK